jgi:hypothetical protein
MTVPVILPAGFSGQSVLAAGARHSEENPLTQDAGLVPLALCLAHDAPCADWPGWIYATNASFQNAPEVVAWGDADDSVTALGGADANWPFQSWPEDRDRCRKLLV